MRQFSAIVRAAALAGALAVPGTSFAASAPKPPPPPPPASAEAMSDVQVRVLRLEQLVEQLTGQIEELRFQNAQMSRQLQQIQDDFSLRVARVEQALGGALTPAQAPVAGSASDSTASAMVAPPAPEKPTSAIPASVSPTAAAMSATPLIDPNAPMSAPVSKQPDMTPRPAAPPPANITATQTSPPGDTGFVIRTDAGGKVLPPDPNAPKAPPVEKPAPPAPAPKAVPPSAPVAASGLNSAPVAIALPNGTPKQQYDYAFDFLKRQDYPRAEAALREFIKRNPKDPLAGNAQYWVGESLYVRGDYQASAVEFMAGYQNFPKSNKGPDNLLKLGMAMSHLNQTPGACTALGRIAKEYPDAPDQIRASAKAERTRLKCA